VAETFERFVRRAIMTRKVEEDEVIYFKAHSRHKVGVTFRKAKRERLMSEI
jgi:hypothetical protein